MPVGSGIAAQLGIAPEVYTNEVQRISGTPSSVFGVTFEGANTITTLATNASAANVQAALEALPNIGTGGVSATGGPLPTAIDVTFSGPLVAGRNVGAMTVQGSVTGLTFSTPTPGTGYGDAVTVTRFPEFVKEGFQMTPNDTVSSALRSGNMVDRSDRWAETTRTVEGDIELEFASKGMGRFLDLATGASVISTPTNGVLTRLQRFTLGDPINKSATVQVGRPDVNGTVRPHTYTGVKIDEFELSMEVDGMLMLTLTCDGQNESTVIALAGASYATAFEQFYSHQAQAQLGGANVDVSKFSVKVQNSLKTDRFLMRSSKLKKQPILADRRPIEGEMEYEYTDLSAYQRMDAGTLTSVIFTVTGSLIENVAAPGPYFNRVVITLPVCRITSDGPNVEGPDILTQSIAFKGLNDGTQEPITIDWYTTDVAL